MNLFDILVLFILGLGLVRGTIRGVIKELSSIMGVSLGFYMAYRYYNVIALNLNPWINNYSYVSIASFLFIFVLTTLSMAFVSLFINHIINFNKRGWASRFCGGIFGLVEGGLLIAILIIVIITFLPQNIRLIKNSHLSPYLIQVSETAVRVTPYDIKLDLFSKIEASKHSYWDNEEQNMKRQLSKP